MEPGTSYGAIVARNLRAARSRAGLGQAGVAARMQALGFTQWVPQTVSKSERNTRRLMVEEILGLSVAMETTIGRLMQPDGDDRTVELQPGGPAVSVNLVRLSVIGQRVFGEVTWDGDKPRIIAEPDYPPAVQDVMRRMAAGSWPPGED